MNMHTSTDTSTMVNTVHTVTVTPTITITLARLLKPTVRKLIFLLLLPPAKGLTPPV